MSNRVSFFFHLAFGVTNQSIISKSRRNIFYFRQVGIFATSFSVNVQMESTEQSDTQLAEKIYSSVFISDFYEPRLSKEKYSALHERATFWRVLTSANR